MLDAKEAAVQTPVRLGPEIDGRFPVLDGLKAGDRVLVQ
jgi:multidrug efflux pump subunit AcrA (membrane-fusion protein)